MSQIKYNVYGSHLGAATAEYLGTFEWCAYAKAEALKLSGELNSVDAIFTVERVMKNDLGKIFVDTIATYHNGILIDGIM